MAEEIRNSEGTEGREQHDEKSEEQLLKEIEQQKPDVHQGAEETKTGSEEQPVQESEKPEEGKEQTDFATLQQKMGVKSPDALAGMYSNLLKDHQSKSRQLADVKRQDVHQEAPQEMAQAPVQPQQGNTFWDNFYKNPAAVLVEANRVLSQPLMDEVKQLRLEREVNNLASGDSTKDILTPEMSQRVSKVLEVRTNFWQSKTPIKDAYFFAKGLSAPQIREKAVEEGKQQGVQSATQRQRAFVEGSQPVQKEPVSIENMSEAELKSQLISQGKFKEY